MATFTTPRRQGRPKLSLMMTPGRDTAAQPKRGAQHRGGGVRVVRQQQHLFAPGSIVHIGAIDAGIGQHVAQPVPHDQHVLLGAHDRGGFGQDQLDEARVLAGEGGKVQRALSGHDAGEVDEAPFGLGNDLLRHDQHVAGHRRDLPLGERGREQRREVAAGAHLRHTAKAHERHGCSAAHAPGSLN
jgi:hypothetical protein